MFVFAGLAVMWGAGTALAQTAPAPELLSPRTLGVGEALRAAATGSLAITLNPSGLALTRSYVIEGTFGYAPDSHENTEMASICDSVTVRVAACLWYEHMGASPGTALGNGDLSLHETGLTLAMPLSEAITIGVTNKYVTFDYNDPSASPTDRAHSGDVVDGGLTIHVGQSINVGAVFYNIIGSDSAEYAQALGFGFAFNFSSALLVAADVRYDLERSTGRWGGGLEYLVSGGDGSQGFPLRAGYVYQASNSASYLTFGLGVVTPRVALDAGMRKQVSNGGELLMQFGLRWFLPN